MIRQSLACAGFILALTGCALDREIAQNEQRVCAKYGPPGSQPFFDCMVTLHGYRPGVPNPVFVITPAPAPAPQIEPTVRCTTYPLGNAVQTVCN